MARDMVRYGRSLMDWPPRWPGRWMDLLDEDGLIRVEEVVEDDALVIRAELPGVDPAKDVEITVANGVLTMRAERHEEKEERGHRRHRSEFRYGSFSRSVPLPAGATDEDVKATFSNGILEVRVPVDGVKAEVKKIPITTA